MNRQVVVACCCVALLAIGLWSVVAAATTEGSSDVLANDARRGDGLEERNGSTEMLSEATEIGIVAQALAATVRVSARNCDGLTIGSGFVADGVLLTNRHLVPEATEVKIDDPGAPVFVGVRARSADSDLALIDPVAVLPLSLAETDANVGQLVWLAGHGGGQRTQVTSGRVHLLTDGSAYGLEGPLMLIDGGSEVGFSGGPVLDEFGQVVGVLQGYEANLRLTLAVPVSAVHSFLASPAAVSQSSADGAETGGRIPQCAG